MQGPCESKTGDNFLFLIVYRVEYHVSPYAALLDYVLTSQVGVMLSQRLVEGMGSAIKMGGKTKEYGALAHPGGSPYGIAMRATRWNTNVSGLVCALLEISLVRVCCILHVMSQARHVVLNFLHFSFCLQSPGLSNKLSFQSSKQKTPKAPVIIVWKKQQRQHMHM